MRHGRRFARFGIWCLGLGAGIVQAGTLHIAVASNFAQTMQALAARFEQTHDTKLVISTGSSGKHFAQISHGAPFDVFFSADSERPRRLEQQGKAVAGSRFTYAIGQLILWSPDPALIDNQGRVLETGAYRYLAIANPRLAPYGQAARQVLTQRGLWRRLQRRIVRGENVGQTFQFVKSGNAQLGFVAYSQVQQPSRTMQGSYWLVPQSLYRAIEQQAVLLNANAEARAFLAFVRDRAARAIIAASGYALPEAGAEQRP